MVIFRRFFILWVLFLGSGGGSFAAVPPSSINLSIEASAADLASMVNRSLPRELYCGKGPFGTSVTVLKTGPVGVSASDNFVYLALPVQLKFSNAVYESYPLRAGLRFKVKINVTPDWRLKTELYYTGLSDNLVETLKLGPLSMKPKSAVENISEPVQKLLAPIIDAKINDAIRLRDKITPLWRSAFDPIPVSKEFSTWLKLTPEKVVMSPLLAVDDRIRLSLGVMTGAGITVGPKPAATPVKPLPPVRHFPAFDKRFHIQLPADIYLADLVTALNPVLLNKTFGDDKKITINSFDLKGENDRLVVVLNSTGAFNGELTLFAKPVYNPRDNSLTFEEVDFDTRNAGWLISAGSRLFRSSVRSAIKSRLDAAVVEQLEAARLKISSALSCLQVAEHVRLACAVNTLSLGEATVAGDRLSVQVIARGESSVSLK
jgi:hypothetical protein